jgi:hypothetical protein
MLYIFFETSVPNPSLMNHILDFCGNECVPISGAVDRAFKFCENRSVPIPELITEHYF